MKSSFLTSVKKATSNMGEAPYDDKKTTAAISEATKRTVHYCSKLKTVAKAVK